METLPTKLLDDDFVHRRRTAGFARRRIRRVGNQSLRFGEETSQNSPATLLIGSLFRVIGRLFYQRPLRNSAKRALRGGGLSSLCRQPRYSLRRIFLSEWSFLFSHLISCCLLAPKDFAAGVALTVAVGD
jgi:hypothetical protein